MSYFSKEWFSKTFRIPFLQVYPYWWLIAFVLLVATDLYTKKLTTNHLNFHLSPNQDLLAGGFRQDQKARYAKLEKYDILGEDGRLITLRLVFNDRFVMGIGPSAPTVGFFLTLFAIIFLIFYHWSSFGSGHTFAWLLVFSGAFGNLIDKAFIKNLNTGEWVFSLAPQPGHVSGVVDMVETIWLGWQAVENIPVISMLSWERYPTFNFADSCIVIGVILMLITMNTKPANTKEKKA